MSSVHSVHCTVKAQNLLRQLSTTGQHWGSTGAALWEYWGITALECESDRSLFTTDIGCGSSIASQKVYWD